MKSTYTTDERIDMVGEQTANYGVPAAVLGVWQTIQGLSISNKRWLADRLVEQVADESIDFISDKELADCFTIDEVEEQLLQMVHKHFSTTKSKIYHN